MRKYLKSMCCNLFAVVIVTTVVSCGGSSGTSPASSKDGNGSGDQRPGNLPPAISGEPVLTVEVGQTYVFQAAGTDPDVDDDLQFVASELPVWLEFNPQSGLLTGAASFTDIGVHEGIEISVSDGQLQSSLPAFSIEVTMDEVEHAIVSGDASVISTAYVLEDAILAAVDSSGDLHRDALLEIFNLQADGSEKPDGSSLTGIDWNPTHDSAWLSSGIGENVPLLVTNSVIVDGYTASNQTMAVLGESESRYIALGGNPMRNYRRQQSSLNEQMHQFLENSINWLTRGKAAQSTSLNVVIAHQDQSYYFPDELAIREWLDERLPDQVFYNEQDACEGDALASCVNAETDLIIISQHQLQPGQESQVVRSIEHSMRNGIPVLYLHYDGGLEPLGESLLALLDVTWTKDNYWQKLGFLALDATTYIGDLDSEVAAFREMVSNFRQGSFNIDWDACDGENCNDNQSLASEFWNGARYVQVVMNRLDAKKLDIFKHPDKFRLHKLMALLGDYYRSKVVFPLDRNDAPGVEFLQAFYADHAAYQYREKVGVWSDLGNFSRTDFSHVTPGTRIVKHVSKRNFRSTGAYALPGETVTVTRMDTSEVNVEVFVNSLRSGSTHVFAEEGYKRPRFLQGERMAIAPGETIRFTSATGGPIQLGYNENDLPVEVKIENIGEHAYWSSIEDSDSYNAKLFADEYDWAELVAPSFEVHSTREKMIVSIDDPYLGAGRGSPQALVDATMRYVHNYPHVLAGFQGPGIDGVEEINQFASSNNLSVTALDLVKHMNADQATCGYGCSGNPYDAYWSFSPLGHGDIHELGHGLERARFRFSGWPGHASTNFYSYYSKTRYHRETGGDPQCQSLPFEDVFNVLNASVSQADPLQYVQENLWDVMTWSQGAAMFIQMMMAAEDVGALQDGWHLLARLHLLEREYQRAIGNDNDWQSTRANLGMSMFDRQSARDLSKEDWLLIMVSHASGYNFTDYFQMWSHDFTDAAAAQVAAMGYPLMPRHYYVSSGDGYCRGEGFDGRKLPVDGQQAWPGQ